MEVQIKRIIRAMCNGINYRKGSERSHPNAESPMTTLHIHKCVDGRSKVNY